MNWKMRSTAAMAALVLAPALAAGMADDPLASWNEGPAKSAIVSFVSAVTQEGSEHFVPAEDRIATFDNDGTLWAEQPLYFQVAFVLDRVRALADAHPEWADTEPFASIIEQGPEAVAGLDAEGGLKVLAAAHAGLSVDEYRQIIADWLDTARHPRFDRPFIELVYQPMLELLDFLRAHDFQVWIVSGGGTEFMRVFAEEVYGIPPEHVVGSTLGLKYEMRDSEPAIVLQPNVEFRDEGPEKAVAIQRFIGKRPIFAFGNSDGDLEMLQWVEAGDGLRFMGLVHHTDDAREWAYDRESHVGTLNRALDAAEEQGWTLVDMKNEWNAVFPFDKH